VTEKTRISQKCREISFKGKGWLEFEFRIPRKFLDSKERQMSSSIFKKKKQGWRDLWKKGRDIRLKV